MLQSQWLNACSNFLLFIFNLIWSTILSWLHSFTNIGILLPKSSVFLLHCPSLHQWKILCFLPFRHCGFQYFFQHPEFLPRVIKSHNHFYSGSFSDLITHPHVILLVFLAFVSIICRYSPVFLTNECDHSVCSSP